MSIGTTGAIIAGTAIAGAGAGVIGSAIGASGAKDAAKTAADAQAKGIDAQTGLTREGLALLKQQYLDSQAQLAPFVDSQKRNLSKLEAFTDPSNPLYQQQRDFSTQQIQRQLAAQGLLRSRAQGDSLSNLELGLADKRLAILQGLAGTGAGQNAAQLSMGYGTQASSLLGGTAQSIGSSFAELGKIQGQGILGSTQAVQGGLSTGFNALQGGLGSYLSLLQLGQLTGKDFLGGGGAAATGFAPTNRLVR